MDWKVRKNIAAGKGERGNLIVHFKVTVTYKLITWNRKPSMDVEDTQCH
jgi:hypothetical protein